MMDFKKYWYLFPIVGLALGIAAYFYLTKGKEMKDKMKAVRDAKAAKAAETETPASNE